MFFTKILQYRTHHSSEHQFQVINKLEKKIVLVFSSFTCSFPWIRDWLFICTNLNSPYQRMLFAKFGWNKPLVLEKKLKMLTVNLKRDGEKDSKIDDRQFLFRKAIIFYSLIRERNITKITSKMKSDHLLFFRLIAIGLSVIIRTYPSREKHRIAIFIIIWYEYCWGFVYYVFKKRLAEIACVIQWNRSLAHPTK